MTNFPITIRALAMALLMATVATGARAQQAPLQDKPFADHRIVLQLSDNDPRKQQRSQNGKTYESSLRPDQSIAVFGQE